MHEEWTDKLSDYLDDELPADERAAVAAHLASCAHCAQVASDLEKVVTQARTITPRPPEADLWAGIDGRISRVSQPRRFAFTLPQLAAAAAVLIAVSGGAAWQLAQRSTPPVVAQAAPPSTAPAPEQTAVDTTPTPASAPVVARVSYADAQYDAAVGDLEKALKTGRGHLDKATIAIVEHNLQMIDQAIEQGRQALDSDPGNSYLSGHLVEARRRKLDLLRRAAALNETD